MIEPKEWQIINNTIQYIEYKINSVTNYIVNSEYPEARRELPKAFHSLQYLKGIINN